MKLRQACECLESLGNSKFSNTLEPQACDDTMTEPRADIDGSSVQHLIDPRLGDAEDDFASPKSRSLFAIAGAFLTEISFAKLLFACTISVGLPAIFMGFAPLAISAWLPSLSAKILLLTEASAAFLLVVTLRVGWLAWRPLLRTA